MKKKKRSFAHLHPPTANTCEWMSATQTNLLYWDIFEVCIGTYCLQETASSSHSVQHWQRLSTFSCPALITKLTASDWNGSIATSNAVIAVSTTWQSLACFEHCGWWLTDACSSGLTVARCWDCAKSTHSTWNWSLCAEEYRRAWFGACWPVVIVPDCPGCLRLTAAVLLMD